MAVLENQILETWQVNHRTNMLLMSKLTEDALDLSINPRGGGKIGHQLAHMFNVRFWKLEAINRTKMKESGLIAVKSKDKKTISLLTELHKVSTEIIQQEFLTAIKNEGKVKGFKRGVIPLLGYFIHHEAHHRGNILLTLKLSGFKLPDELKYGIWEWNKI
ncbi:DinB family protein [Mesonia sp.]|uniref:DinB family protein n=1 Tax=Mesonia sp. TaxID=1960830 RepID=UPI00177131C2|nr:DinB family protein [Mesonia sp.]HIB36787.1 hypothetical protein [Mesonia sp.]HIO26227.1 hypothetical protein [Flavobacteriaceae bacterium]